MQKKLRAINTKAFGTYYNCYEIESTELLGHFQAMCLNSSVRICNVQVFHHISARPR